MKSRAWRQIGVVAIVLSTMTLAGCSAAAGAQACPVAIETVSRQALTSDMGIYGSALRISFRNTSPFPIRCIEFGIEAVQADNRSAKANVIISNHVIQPKEADTLLWNSTRFDKRNGANVTFVVWPALIVMGDGSKWAGNSGECEYRSDESAKSQTAEPDAKGASSSASPYTPDQLQALVDNGKASLVNVTSDPSGANVDVDARLIGKTPLTFVLAKNLNGEARNIMIYKAGYRIKERDVTPNGGAIAIDEKLSLLTNSTNTR